MKNKGIILIISAIILLSLAVFLYNNLDRTKGIPSQQTDQELLGTELESETSSDLSLRGSLFDLVKLGKTLQCTYNGTSEGTTFSGTSYVSGNKMRGDYDIVTGGSETIEGHMIMDGDWVYTWTSQLPQGFKMNVSEIEDIAGEDSSTDNKTLESLGTDYDYNCSAWSEDSSLFEIPQNITFTDFSATLKKFENNQGNLCSACDLIPNDSDKTACKERLNCE